MSVGVPFRLALAAAAAVPVSGLDSQSSIVAEYVAFRKKFRNSEDDDPVNFKERVGLFRKRKAEVEAHNAQPGVSWVATVDNPFADYTSDEWNALLDYKRHAGWKPTGGNHEASSFLEVQDAHEWSTNSSHLLTSNGPFDVDWRVDLTWALNRKEVPSQGGCGSCWAVAAISAIEAHWELEHKRENMSYVPEGHLSTKQLVECTQNKRHCGGTGGCAGATGWLALQQVMDNGIPYDQGDGKVNCNVQDQPHLTIGRFTRLRTNDQGKFEQAVGEGPVIGSVAAKELRSYGKGVFTGCTNWVVNHAILVVGYGTDPESGLKYYIIRNSWGPSWGEHGYIRLERPSLEKPYCGIDDDMSQGNGCDGEPQEAKVCGPCGLFSDTSIPHEITEVNNSPEGAQRTSSEVNIHVHMPR